MCIINILIWLVSMSSTHFAFQVFTPHDVEPPVEDVVSGLRLCPHVAICASICMQLPLLLGSLLQSHHQYWFGGATADAPRDSGALNQQWGRLLSSLMKNVCSCSFLQGGLIQDSCLVGKTSYWADVWVADGINDWLLLFPNCSMNAVGLSVSVGIQEADFPLKQSLFISLIFDSFWSNAANCCNNTM